MYYVYNVVVVEIRYGILVKWNGYNLGIVVHTGIVDSRLCIMCTM